MWGAPQSPGEVVRTQLSGPLPRVSEAGLGWGLRLCISSKFPGDIGATGLASTLRTSKQTVPGRHSVFLGKGQN